MITSRSDFFQLESAKVPACGTLVSPTRKPSQGANRIVKNIRSKFKQILATFGLVSLVAASNSDEVVTNDTASATQNVPAKNAPQPLPSSIFPSAPARKAPDAEVRKNDAENSRSVKIDSIVPVDVHDAEPPFPNGQKLELKASMVNLRDVRAGAFRRIMVLEKRNAPSIAFDGRRPLKHNREMDIMFLPVLVSSGKGESFEGYISSALLGESETVEAERGSQRKGSVPRGNEAILSKTWEAGKHVAFRKEIRNLQPYVDRFDLYEVRTGMEEFQRIIGNFGLGESHIPAILHISAHLAKHESHNNYGARGVTITNPKSVHFGDKAIGGWQFMPNTWAYASQKYFRAILPPTPENQEKVGFSLLAEYYKRNLDRGLSFSQICGKIAIRWYGTGKVLKWQPTPTQYAKNFLGTVLSDSNVVNHVDKLIERERGVAVVAANQDEIYPAPRAQSSETDTQMPAIRQTAFETRAILDMPAVNDPNYFKSSVAVRNGMEKVSQLKTYLIQKPNKNPNERKYAVTLAKLGQQMIDSNAEIVKHSGTNATRELIEHQIRKGHAIKAAMALTQEIAPKEEIRSTLAAGIAETQGMIQKVVDFNTHLREREEERRRKESQLLKLSEALWNRPRGMEKKAA